MSAHLTQVVEARTPELVEITGDSQFLCVDEPLTESEKRVLRYLPTQLTALEIARQLFLSVHTVTTHMRHIYAKLGVHRRHEAVDRARACGLLAPIPGSRRVADEPVSQSRDAGEGMAFRSRTSGSAPSKATVSSRRPWPVPTCRRSRTGYSASAPTRGPARFMEATVAVYVNPGDVVGRIQECERYGYPLLWVVRGSNIVKMVVE
jgi:DNA-binding CsgD family transcriptional regulator